MPVLQVNNPKSIILVGDDVMSSIETERVVFFMRIAAALLWLNHLNSLEYVWKELKLYYTEKTLISYIQQGSKFDGYDISNLRNWN